jgi:hypothetical protein
MANLSILKLNEVIAYHFKSNYALILHLSSNST